MITDVMRVMVIDEPESEASSLVMLTLVVRLDLRLLLEGLR